MAVWVLASYLLANGVPVNSAGRSRLSFSTPMSVKLSTVLTEGFFQDTLRPGGTLRTRCLLSCRLRGKKRTLRADNPKATPTTNDKGKALGLQRGTLDGPSVRP